MVKIRCESTRGRPACYLVYISLNHVSPLLGGQLPYRLRPAYLDWVIGRSAFALSCDRVDALSVGRLRYRAYPASMQEE